MSFWRIQPRDPLIFRDGKPFSSDPGSRAKSLSFIPPSVIAGHVRTRAGTDPNTGRFTASPETVRNIGIVGPVLMDDKETCYFPAPLDALLTETEAQKAENKHTLLRLLPQKPQGLSNLPEGLYPVHLQTKDKSKPAAMPAFWRWSEYLGWLTQPQEQEVHNWGFKGFQFDQRTHVALDSVTQSGKDGKLFQTSGLEFNHGWQRLAMKIQVNYPENTTLQPLQAGFYALGGERRLANWQADTTVFPPCPEKITENIVDTGYCRLILATPAYFKRGYLPTDLCSYHGKTLTVQAVSTARPEVLSGWDFATNAPKCTRRFARAGSVYFISLENLSPEERKDWVKDTWLHNISDDEQNRKDGFGLALLGTWQGVEK